MSLPPAAMASGEAPMRVLVGDELGLVKGASSIACNWVMYLTTVWAACVACRPGSPLVSLSCL